MKEMLHSTTPTLQGYEIVEYRGIVTGEAILGANVVKDFFAGISDLVGGRSAAYEDELEKARIIALQEMEKKARLRGANAVVGVDIDYETIRGTMLMVSVSGTAVDIEKS